VGDLEIVHPVIMVPSPHSDCSCAHVKIINLGSRPEYLLGAETYAAQRAHVIMVSATRDVTSPTRIEIPPGNTLNLHQHGWCLFMSGITKTLEADMMVVEGRFLFENQPSVTIAFMVTSATGLQVAST
jgi:copper(I)-binding protein